MHTVPPQGSLWFWNGRCSLATNIIKILSVLWPQTHSPCELQKPGLLQYCSVLSCDA